MCNTSLSASFLLDRLVTKSYIYDKINRNHETTKSVLVARLCLVTHSVGLRPVAAYLAKNVRLLR